MNAAEFNHGQVQALAERLQANLPSLQIGRVEMATEVALSSFTARTGSGIVLSIGNDLDAPQTFIVVRSSGGSEGQLPFEQEFVDGSGESTGLSQEEVLELVEQYIGCEQLECSRER